MEAISLYLLKSAVWLTGFASIYLLFLRNERFFGLNRIFLISGALASIIFPLINWHYVVELPMVLTTDTFEPQLTTTVVPDNEFQRIDLLFFAYISGALYLIYRIIKQTSLIINIIQKSEIRHLNSVKLIRTNRYPAPFSFFSFVFVNPSISDTETNEIVHHEGEHIRQKHWIDLLLFETLCIIQWFNPTIWLYGRFIRQNHEYLADEKALQRTANPAIYRAALLNQMFDAPVIQLTNSFNYSLNKKRFNMMKQTISSPTRKLKFLLVLPLMAGVFYAFATPEYKFIYTEAPVQSEILDLTSDKEPAQQAVQPNSDIQFEAYNVKGKVINADMTTIQADSIKIKKSDSVNAVAKKKPGLIMLDGVVISHEEMEKISPANIASISVLKDKSAIETYGEKAKDGVILITSKDKTAPLIVIDGVRRPEKTMTDINPETIESVSVLKNESSKALYGEHGKNGVVLITTKEGTKTGTNKTNQEVTVVGYGTHPPLAGNIRSTNNFQIIGSDFSANKALYVIDGIRQKDDNLSNLNPETIASISVLKNESGKALYGEDGKNGVILITTKNAKREENSDSNPEVTVVGYGSSQASSGKISIRSVGNLANSSPLVVIDGTIQKEKTIKDIDPETIQSINVLKNESAIQKYGDAAKNGVIEVTQKSESTVYSVTEQMPEFPGGQLALRKYLTSNLRYPKRALTQGIQGKVFVSFVVTKTGKIDKVKISRGVDTQLDAEAIRIVKSMPKWTPGKTPNPYTQTLENSAVSYTVPVNFKLPESTNQETLKKSEITETKNKLIIVPNPATDNATITLDGAVQPARLEVSVYDRFGKLMKKEQKNGPTFSLSVSDLITGTYYLLVSDNTKQYTGSLLVAR